MRIAVIADVHGNLEALNAVLADLKESSPDTVVSLGDAVGYGADPGECCAVLRDLVSVNILGNHDAASVGMLDTESFNNEAKDAVRWTADRLSPENAAWLRGSPYTFSENRMLFSHGSPVNPDEFDYVVTFGAIEDIFSSFGGTHRIFFVGHAHRRFSASKDLGSPSGGYAPAEDFSDTVRIESGRHYLISVGSVGQPRDFDASTSYGILDTDSWIYRVKRLEYDIRTAGEKIIKAGLPKWLAYRLTIGV